MSRWAPDNADGLHAYAVTTQTVWDMSKGRPGHVEIKYAESLAVARSQYGWTRQLHTTVRVRRATPDDVADGAA